MRTKSEIGTIGEDIACEFLKKNKYRVIARNQRIPAGEIDVIARDKNGVLVFIEVKALAGESAVFLPEQHFNEEKRLRVRRLAQAFVNRHPEYISEKLGYRIDLIAVSIKDPLDKNWQQAATVRHYENL